MSLPENPPGDIPIKPDEAKGESEAMELLQSEVRSLRILFNTVMVALIILTSSLFHFMMREKKIIRRQIDDNLRYIADYKRRVEPRVIELNSKLLAYSKLHTNFTPILLRYFGTTNPPSAASTTSAVPVAPSPGLGTETQAPPP